MSVIAVIDCGMGNLHSLQAGIQRADATATVVVTADPSTIAQADKIIFPGDGHFDACVQAIDVLQLRPILIKAAQEKPFLGICVGMQVLFASSEEGQEAGLGVIPARVRRLLTSAQRKVPHMGWNNTYHLKTHPLTKEIADSTRFYYIHSYCAPLGEWTLMTATYGITFSAIIQSGTLLATQFHPEKSGAAGIHLLTRFTAL